MVNIPKNGSDKQGKFKTVVQNNYILNLLLMPFCAISSINNE